MLFVRTKDYQILSGVLLAVTGCEAMFANLGHFNMLSIQISFSTFVFPSLALAYLGQGARLISDGDAVISNIFYKTIPGPANGPLFWIVFVFAILATLDPADNYYERPTPAPDELYVGNDPGSNLYPSVLVAVIIVVAVFKNLTALTNAYGFAVATVMFSTTVLIAIQIRYVKHLPAIVGIAYFLVFGFFDGLFWGAALTKVPKGAWVPLMIGIVLMLFMLFWTWAKRLEDQFDGANRRNLRHFILTDNTDKKETLSLSPDGAYSSSIDANVLGEDKEGDPSYYFLTSQKTREDDDKPESIMEERMDLARIPTCAIFHKLTSGKGVPHTFIGYYQSPEFLSKSVMWLIKDSFEVQIEHIVDRVCVLEINADPKGASEKIAEIRHASRSTTHM
ncbi:hypothetical protein HWV62_16954 [Athelia sp. TMB]|nr:hypothetical protein HWV62_16954 [Athelia sp. TMB]